MDVRATVLEFYPFIRAIAWKVTSTFPPSAYYLFDDLVGEGVLGLYDAIKHYKPSLGELKPFASVRIRGAMLDYLRRLDHTSRIPRHNNTKIERANGYDSHTKAKSLGITLAQYRALESNATVVKLEALGNRDAGALSKEIESFINLSEIHEALKILPKREKKIIEMYFFKGLGPKQISKHFGISLEYASMLKLRALNKLKEYLNSKN